jgi:adenosylcobinamide kinase/adenosylcobinamide-phosphate guanylyltransferase
LITGGSGSGKTAYALKLASKFKTKAYIATAEITDDEMLDKIKKHQEERDLTYATYECPLELNDILSCITSEDVIVLDCITFWINNILYYEKDFNLYFNNFINSLVKLKKEIIIVTNEVNVGIIPYEQNTRNYVKKVSKVNRKIAELSDNVYLMVAGIPLKIK